MPGQITTRPLKLDSAGNAKNKPTPLPKSTQFWFGLLTKLGSLRASGPPPRASAS